MKHIFTILMLIILTSCGSQPKGLFSEWHNDAGSELDLTTAHFGTQLAGIFGVDGSICAFDLTITGEEHAGVYVIENDTCDTYDGVGTFTNNSNTLTLIDSDGSSVWH